MANPEQVQTAFVFGVIPLITATGAGAEMRQYLGTVVFFGMIGVTVFGLFLTPVFYTVIRALTGSPVRERSLRARVDGITGKRGFGSSCAPGMTPSRVSLRPINRGGTTPVRRCEPS